MEYLYDGDGRICAVANYTIPYMTIMTGYLYDAEGRRVAKGTITAWSCDPTVNHFQTTNDYILGLAGEQVTEMGVGGASSGSTTNGLVWQHTNVWAAGKLLATYDGGSSTNGGLHFYFDDPLGTRRVQTDASGNVEQRCSSLPYGDGETCGPTPTEHLFTGKERDTESGNDYFGARYYNSDTGRFLSPDWSAKYEPVPYASLGDPQTLNLYSYVRNNPLASVDPDGHWDSNIFPNIAGMLDPAVAAWQNASDNLINQELAKHSAQQQGSALSKFLGYFYGKGFQGVGDEIHVKVFALKIDIGKKSGTEVTQRLNGEKETTEIKSDFHIRGELGPVSLGFERKVTGDQSNAKWDFSGGWKGIEGSGGQVGGGVGGCFGVCRSIEGGVEAGRMFKDLSGWMNSLPNPGPFTFNNK